MEPRAPRDPAPPPAPPVRTPQPIRLFRALGIEVYLHWSWLLVALIELQTRRNTYSSQLWNVVEYLTLFGIVLLHEFGHALACRSVGGVAERIVLWPLGGVAYVNPPPRPGATLWSIAAGPLVNVVLLPVTLAFMALARNGALGPSRDLLHYATAVAAINFVLLAFNLLPIYPLDGGQILRSLLWYWLGRARSLKVVAVVGLVGAAALLALAALLRDLWLVVIAGYNAVRSWSGYKQASVLARLLALPRRAGPRCPTCDAAPPLGPFWQSSCGAGFDAFEGDGSCPACGAPPDDVICPECARAAPPDAWRRPSRRAELPGTA